MLVLNCSNVYQHLLDPKKKKKKNQHLLVPIKNKYNLT